MNTTLKMVDEQLAIDRAGGSLELARELFGMLEREIPVYIDQVSQLYQGNRLTDLIQIVHKINGGAAYCGAPALKAAADGFEKSLKNRDSDDYPAAYSLLLHELTRLIDHPPNRPLF